MQHPVSNGSSPEEVDRSNTDANRLPIYIVHYAAPTWCGSSVKSLSASISISVDITVVNNGGAGNIADYLPQDIRVITPPCNIGFAGGANMAIEDWLTRYPDGQYMVLGSHDLHVREDALGILLNAAERNPQFGVLAPAVLGREHRMSSVISPDGLIAITTWVSGACMLLRRGCVTDIGGFDPAFGSYVEDVEFCLRAADGGWLIGIALASEAWGLGSARTRDRDVLIELNMLLLARRRGGAIAVLRGIARLLCLIGRAAISSVLPFRSEVQRERARYLLGVRTDALGRAINSLACGAWSSTPR